jgi:uncharacterized YkwD family protein
MLPTPAPTPEVSEAERYFLSLVNGARAEAGLAPLVFDCDLQRAARFKSADMTAEGYFSHQSPTYGSPFEIMKMFGVMYSCAGENIAGNADVKNAFERLMLSAGHRANILGADYTITGVAIDPNDVYGLQIIQMFVGR